MLLIVATDRFTSEAHANGNSCEREIHNAAARYGIPEGILYSVGLAETGQKGSLQPFALNVEGKAVFTKSADEAMAAFYEASAKGATLIDLGCMQINHHFHGEHFQSPEEMLVPAKNVDYAARFLADLHARHETWTMAVARYHAGPKKQPGTKSDMSVGLSPILWQQDMATGLKMPASFAANRPS